MIYLNYLINIIYNFANTKHDFESIFGGYLLKSNYHNLIMEFRPTLDEVKNADFLKPIILEAIRSEQEKIQCKDGIYFVDFKRGIEPCLRRFIDQGMEIHPLLVDRLFCLMFAVDGLFLSNSDFSKYSVIEIDGFYDWNHYHEERFKGYKLDNELLSLKSEESN